MMKKQTLFLRIALIILSLAIVGMVGGLIPVAILIGIISDWSQFTYQWAYIGLALEIELTVIAFLFAVSQVWLILNQIEKRRVFTELTIKPIKRIKYASLFVFLLFVVGAPIAFFVAQAEDAPGIVLMDFLVALAGATMTVFSAVLQKLLSEAITFKKENELTV
ncbi:DUF2975 domain-containing protein [Secundilactobacillus malefermentans]|nr:DUF2975 domain-containing protein [Secundilactobacillus malefermentans]KRM57424.1 YoaS protein [Secundilactobacillus malefermentans DSM 5705 = KCTC 3548]